MEQRITLVTLGVSDYERAKAFYGALGWSPALEVEETAFFQGNGVIIALWGREKLGPDLGIPDGGANQLLELVNGQISDGTTHVGLS